MRHRDGVVRLTVVFKSGIQFGKVVDPHELNVGITLLSVRWLPELKKPHLEGSFPQSGSASV